MGSDLERGRYSIDPIVPPTAIARPVFGESRYTEADPCFEQDNDGDGWFDDDKVDCPGGTYMGTELDHDQQTYTIGAELRPSCKARDYTPGEYYGVSSAETGETALERLSDQPALREVYQPYPTDKQAENPSQVGVVWPLWLPVRMGLPGKSPMPTHVITPTGRRAFPSFP